MYCVFDLGSTSLDKLMTTLISIVEQHNFILQREVQEEVGESKL